MAKLFSKEISVKIKEYHESQKLVKAKQFPDLDMIFSSIDTKGLDIFDLNNVTELSKFYKMIRQTDTYHDAAIVLTNIKSNIIPLEILQHFCKTFINIIWVKEGEENKIWQKSVKDDSDISWSDSEEEPNLSFNDELDEQKACLDNEGISVEDYLSRQDLELAGKSAVEPVINTPFSESCPTGSVSDQNSKINLPATGQNYEFLINQFQKMHNETLSGLATIKKTLVNQNLLVRQLSEKLTSLQTEVKNINAVLPLIRPTHTSVLEKVHKY